MPTVKQLRDGLATRLATITGLRTSAFVPDSLSPPAAVVGAPERVEYDVTFARGATRFSFPVRLYAAKVSERNAQERLDAYLAPDGASSVKLAVEGDDTLGGVAHTSRVSEARGYGVYTIAGSDYLGVEFLVEVIA